MFRLVFILFSQQTHWYLIYSKVDIGGSLAIASKGLYATGVSTDINISYISGAKLGETITLKAKVDKLGKTLAFTTVELYAKDRLGTMTISAYSLLTKQS